MQAPTTGFRLTPTRLEILRRFDKYGLLDRRHIQSEFYRDTPSQLIRCNRTLKALKDQGLIAEIPQLLPGHIDRPAVYGLTPEGHKTIGTNGRTRELKRAPLVLEHRRSTNGLLLRLEAAAKTMGWEIVTEAEATVRQALKDHKNLPIPDGRIQLGDEGFLLECDRGTEGKIKFEAKIAAYNRAGAKGRLKSVFGTDKLRVLIVTKQREYFGLPNDPAANLKRLGELKRYVENAAGASQRFWLTTEDQFLSSNPLTDPIWLTPRQSQLQQLI